MLTFHPLSSVSSADLLALLNDPEVQRHMPLTSEPFSEAGVRAWAASKDAQWQEIGYGPWAFRLDGVFAGWGGFQKEGEDADFGLVLSPAHWGHGKQIFDAVIAKGFGELGFKSIIVLLPPSRKHLKPLNRLGFVPDGQIDYDGHVFLQFRLWAPKDQ